MSWASGKGRFLGALNPRYRLPRDVHRGKQTDPADTRAGPLGEAVHHSRGPRTRHRPAARPGTAQLTGAARRGLLVGLTAASVGVIYGYDLSSIAGALLFITDQFRPDDFAARTADDDGGDRPDRRRTRWRRAGQCDRAKEVDGADRRRLRGVRAAGRDLGVDADAADGAAAARCDHRRLGGGRPGVRGRVGAGGGARIVADRLSAGHDQRTHPRLPGRLPAGRHAQLAVDAWGWPPYPRRCCCRC